MAWGPKLLPVSIVKVREQKTEKWAILSSDIRNPWLKNIKQCFESEVIQFIKMNYNKKNTIFKKDLSIFSIQIL